MRFTLTVGKRLLVFHEFFKHVERLHVLVVVIANARATRDFTDRVNRRPTDFPNAFRENVGHRENLRGVIVE